MYRKRTNTSDENKSGSKPFYGRLERHHETTCKNYMWFVPQMCRCMDEWQTYRTENILVIT